MINEELLPCPFCGGTPHITERDVEPQGDSWYSGKDAMFVLCECGAVMFDGYFHEGFGSPIEAAEKWNTRAELARRSEPVALSAGDVEVPAELVIQWEWELLVGIGWRKSSSYAMEAHIMTLYV